MGCVCCSLSSFVSIVLDAFERISMCTMCALLTCCLLFTIVAVLVLGIGIGYHYCAVTRSVEAMSSAVKATSALRSGPEGPGNGLRTVNKVARRVGHNLSRREADTPVGSITNNTTNSNDTQPLSRNNTTIKP